MKMLGIKKHIKLRKNIKTKSFHRDFEPWWFQKKYMMNIKKFHLNVFRTLLNKDIILGAKDFRIRQLREKTKQIENNHIYEIDHITFEKQWTSEFIKFINCLKDICSTIKFCPNNSRNCLCSQLEFRIFGGIINKIINPSFYLEDHDIDIYLSATGSYSSVPPELQLQFLEKVKRHKLLIDLVDSSKLRNDFAINGYGRLVNRPGLNGLKHFKARRYFEKIGFIKVDILTGRPNNVGVDCLISNLEYCPYRETISTIRPQVSLIGTLMDIRHKVAKLIIPDFSGASSVEQVMLLESRQKKYKLQNWNVKNSFTFPKVSESWECCICFDASYDTESHDNVITFECNHSFCKSCVKKMISTDACLSKNSCPLCRSPIKVKLEICNKDEDLYRTKCVCTHGPNINLGLSRRPISDEDSDDDDSEDDSDDDSNFEMPELEEVNSDQNDSEVVYFDENQFTGIAELFANYDTNNPDHPYHGYSQLNRSDFTVFGPGMIINIDVVENQSSGIAELFANYDTNNPDHPMHGFTDEDRLANEAIVNTWANAETSDDSDDSDFSDDSDVLTIASFVNTDDSDDSDDSDD